MAHDAKQLVEFLKQVFGAKGDYTYMSTIPTRRINAPATPAQVLWKRYPTCPMGIVDVWWKINGATPGKSPRIGESGTPPKKVTIMNTERRDFILMTGAAALGAVAPGRASSQGEKKMYGLIGKMTAVEGQRDALIAILLEGVSGMPGCLSYIVAKDPADANAIWITEVWDSKTSHEASLSIPSVRQAIARGKPLIAGFGERVVTEPVGGHGLAQAKAR